MTEIGIQFAFRHGGLKGITRIRKDGRVIGYQARTLLPSKKSLTKYFSVDSYGAASALAMALTERKHQLAERDRLAGGAAPGRTVRKKRTNRPTMQLIDVDREAEVAAQLMSSSNVDFLGIDRNDITNAEGWCVAIDRRRKHLRQYFFDAAYGGAEQSLAEAVAYRNSLAVYSALVKRRAAAGKATRSPASKAQG
ncbi:hypothetical protein [Lysobacter sp. CA199]|uniref:hypothetical protein n=1 Tax=Lysobacter sp. CA199 TaxID=3455608 RepID=UPI003F8CFC25